MWKSSLKLLKRSLLGILALLLIYFLLAIGLSFWGTRPEKLECERSEAIYIATNGIHIDLILPLHLVSEDLQTGLNLNAFTPYAAFGWGDKGFYLETPTWGDLKFSTAMRALFLKSGTAMHLSLYRRPREDWVKIPVCDQQVKLINEYIENSFKKDSQGQIQELPDSGYTTSDRFYEANGSYNCFNTCNYWVNKGLKSAEIKTAVWSPFDHGLLYHARKHNSK